MSKIENVTNVASYVLMYIYVQWYQDVYTGCHTYQHVPIRIHMWLFKYINLNRI